jgi:ankyrin repeat protein
LKNGPTDSYCQDIFTHPLFQQGYSFPSVVNIQQALVMAIQGGHTNIVAVLLDFGAQANFYYGERVQCLITQYTRNRWHSKEVDYPPLFTAVQFGSLELVKLLLQGDADPELYAPSPLYRAVKDDRRNIIPVLLEYGVGPQATALKLAVLHEDESMVRLLDEGLNVSQYGYAGLYTAKIKGDQDMVDLLESQGATLAAFTDTDKRNWAKEDGDGTRRPIFHLMFISDETGIEEDEEEDEVQNDED